jgi:tripartite-type tricarboxylate transporter receptor subunit TctC
MIHAVPRTSHPGKTAGLAAVLSAFAFITPAAVHAEDAYPGKPIRIVVPYTPGGGVDIVTRLVGQAMALRLKQVVIVDNRPGAGTNIGMSAAAKSDPDGYTLLTVSNTLASNGALYPKLNYSPTHDFAPVGGIGYAPLVVVVPAASPFKTLQEMVAYGKANPEKLSYGSAGNGSSGHLASELLKDQAGFQALHVAYKGGSQAVTDLIGDRISFMSINPLEVVAHTQSGKLRALAVMDKAPSPLLPAVPTVASLGLPGSTTTVWWGLVGPRAMPAEVVAKLNKALREALADPAVVKRFADMGATVTPTSPAQFGSFVEGETAKWTRVIKAGGIQAD